MSRLRTIVQINLKTWLEPVLDIRRIRHVDSTFCEYEFKWL